MKNNEWTHSIAFLFLLTLFSNPRARAQVISEKPNIIFILTDDQRFDALGYQGNKLIHTPEMDELAKTGTYF